MIPRLDILLRPLAAMALAALTALLPSCSSTGDTPDSPTATDNGVYSFGLYLSVGDDAIVSRSTPTDGDVDGESGYDPGAGYENYIDLASQDYRIYLFNSNNRLIYAVPESTVTLLPTNGSVTGSKTYELRFKLTEEQLTSANLRPEARVFKLLMLANWRSYPTSLAVGSTTIDDLMTSPEALRSYQPPTDALLSADDRIAMFGIKQFGAIALDDQWLTSLGTLHLLRSYAKIEVYDAETTTTPINSVALTRYSTRSFCAPMLKSWQESEYVTNSYKTDYGLTFRDPEAERSEELPLRKDAESGHYFIYVPEFRNLVAGSSAIGRPEGELSRLRVSYLDETSGDEHIYYVDFKYYDEVNADRNGAKKGDFFNISRNYWYRYSLNRGKVDLTMQVDVVPYAEVLLNPGFGFDDPLPRPPSEWTVPPWVEIEE